MASSPIFPRFKKTFAVFLCSLPELLSFSKRLKEIIVVKICGLLLWFNVIRATITEDLQNAFQNHSVDGKVLICRQLLFLIFEEYHHFSLYKEFSLAIDDLKKKVCLEDFSNQNTSLISSISRLKFICFDKGKYSFFFIFKSIIISI